MGAPTLNKKVELHYRRKSTSKACQYCNHIVLKTTGTSEHEYRCRIIGVEPGRSYRISRDGLCDAYDGSNYLDRLSRGMWRKPKETEEAQ